MLSFRKIKLLEVFGLIVPGALILLVADLAVRAECQKPNPSEVFCATLPADAVSSCIGTNADTGLGCAVQVYEIKIFRRDQCRRPHTGTTTQTQSDCKRSKTCVLDQQLGLCVDHASGFSTWTLGAKTVVGTNPCSGG